MRTGALIILLILTCCGCATMPFKEVRYVSVKTANPEEVINKFASALPKEFQILSSIVFRYRFISLFALGYTKIDAVGENFAVSCFNPAGIKLFELSGNGDTVNRLFVMDELSKKGDVGGTVAEDIKRIYLKRLPAQSATVKKEKYRIIFRQPWKKGILEYVFAGEKKLLIRKNYYENKKIVWSVFYYEYTLKNNKQYPQGIILKNYQYHYELISRLREIRA